jgi:uncharacterized damage-inducible protein DinB
MTTASIPSHSHSHAIVDLAYCDPHRELTVTRKVLERLPEDKFSWKVHEKSMSLGRLAMHVATIPEWMLMTIRHDVLDMANPPKMKIEPENHADLMKTFDTCADAVTEALGRLVDHELEKTWSMKQGDQVIYSSTKNYVLRVWCANHLVHHRGQLCVYLRILGVPVPAVYFNSSDEPNWVFE